jgi:hypothetical protein
MPSGELRIIAFGIFQYILVIACVFTHIILIMCIHKGIVRRAALGVAAGKEQEGAEVGQRKCVGGIARQHAAVHALRFLGTETNRAGIIGVRVRWEQRIGQGGSRILSGTFEKIEH